MSISRGPARKVNAPDTARPHDLPRHVAIIMDGNGRWARKRGLPRYAGHRAGVESVRSTVEHCASLGIEALTLFAFSSENWRRPKKEVGILMDLFLNALERELTRLTSNNVRLKVIGDLSAFSDKLRATIDKVEQATRDNTGLRLTIAANYGGRWDITEASRCVARRVEAGEIRAEAVTEADLGGCLALAGLPEPDLFIRTGGDQRISNFLLWQLAYTELYFTDTPWPEFDVAALDRAIDDFSGRERRFGQTGEQIADKQELSV